MKKTFRMCLVNPIVRTLGVALTSCIAFACSDSAGTFDDTRSAELRGSAPTRYPAFSGLFTAYLNGGFIQRYSFGAYLDPQDPGHLLIQNRTAGTASSALLAQTYDEAFDFSCSFEITAVQAKSRDHYYVAGREGNVDIVERWKKAQVLPPGGGSASYVMKRTRLFSGPLGGVKSIGVDHAGRYLMVLHGTSPTTLSKMPLPSGGAPTPLYTSAAIPEMDSGAFSVFARMHATEGLVWTLEDGDPFGPGNYVLFRDSDDDGNLDTWSVLSREDYFSVYSIATNAWSDWFMAD